MNRVLGLLLGPEAAEVEGPPNAMRLTFHPRGLRPAIINWEPTAAALIQWLHRDLLRTGDVETRRLLDELLGYPDVPRQWRTLDLDASTVPFLAIEMRRGDVRLSFFTVLASLGTPYEHHPARAPDRMLLRRRPRDRGGASPPRVTRKGRGALSIT